MTVEIAMFGALTLRDGERRIRASDLGGTKPRGILELLLLARGHAVSKDYLAECLWPVKAPRNVAGTLETYISVLRQRLFNDRARARPVIVTTPNAYMVDVEFVDFDLDRFDTLLLLAERAVNVHDRRRLLTEAVAIGHSDLLEDSPYAPWAHAERLVYRDRVARAHLAIARDDLACGDSSAALRHSDHALRFAPYSEQAFRLIMAANYALGHDDMARATFARCRVLLADELGVDPTTETHIVSTAIDAGAPVNEVVARVAVVSDVPDGRGMQRPRPSAAVVDLTSSSHPGMRGRRAFGQVALSS